MYITIDMLIKAGSAVTALTAFSALTWKLFRWINHQKEQDAEIEQIKAQHKKDIEDLRQEHMEAVRQLEAKHDREMEEMKESSSKSTSSFQEELTLITYGLLACLQGLNEQGCDGPVSVAIDKINKYLNNKAHDQH